jgi:hypothetical protein
MSSAPERARPTKLRNSHAAFKIAVRRLVACTANDDVFDMFAGDGAMWRACWNVARRGVTCDLDESSVAVAARERPMWTVLKVNVERALRFGVWRQRPFSIIDIDTYGSPWSYFAALFGVSRLLANPCRLVLSDHYMGHRNIAYEDLALGFRRPGTPDNYLQCVDRLLEKTVGAQGWSYERKLYRDDKAVQHVFTLSRAADGETPAKSGRPKSSRAR